MGKIKGHFVKICPDCFSSKLSVRIFDAGHYYDCLSCGKTSFYPMEFDADALDTLRAGYAKKVVKKKAKKSSPKVAVKVKKQVKKVKSAKLKAKSAKKAKKISNVVKSVPKNSKKSKPSAKSHVLKKSVAVKPVAEVKTESLAPVEVKKAAEPVAPVIPAAQALPKVPAIEAKVEVKPLAIETPSAPVVQHPKPVERNVLLKASEIASHNRKAKKLNKAAAKKSKQNAVAPVKVKSPVSKDKKSAKKK